jgi:hypothetical protein
MMTTVLNVPVSNRCNFILIANGPYDRKQVENFILMLGLHVELGAFGPPQLDKTREQTGDNHEPC